MHRGEWFRFRIELSVLPYLRAYGLLLDGNDSFQLHQRVLR